MPSRTEHATSWRIVATIVAVAAFGAANALLTPAATVMSARMVGEQFANSDTSYLAQAYGTGLAQRLVLPGIILLAALVWIWFVPLKRLLSTAAVIALCLLGASPVRAYYDKTDYTEAVTIYPNETAFWIPDNGGNKDSQGRLDSADYYNSNRVALKRFIVPHTQLSGSGWGPWGNYFTPAGRLILVDRTPYNREWTKASGRGTSARDESFPCQDRDGHDVTVEITIDTSVAELDAAKFLYRFGVKPPAGDRIRPEVIFTSVYYGRSLNEAMDTVGRGKVQALVCGEISIRPMDQVNSEAAAMLASIEQKAKAFFGDYGVTLDYIGWAGTFAFSDGIQSAIDRRYIADKDQQIAALLAPYAVTIQTLAAADALRAFAHKTDGKLPSTIVGLPSNVAGLLQGLLSPAVPVTSHP